MNRIDKEKQSVLSWRAAYCCQALIRISDNTKLLEKLGKFTPAAGGVAYLATFGLKVAAGVTLGGILGGLELTHFWEAYKCFSEAFKASTKKTFEAWYGALQLIDFLIEMNQIEKIGELLAVANQSSSPWPAFVTEKKEFVFGLCDWLERLAYHSHQKTRDDALRLLQGLKAGKMAWGQQPEVSAYAAFCLNRMARGWSKPDTTESEAAGYFPSIWDPFWQGEAQNTLLTAVRDKTQRHVHQQFIPVMKDAVVNHNIKLDELQASTMQISTDTTQSLHALSVINTKLDALTPLSKPWSVLRSEVNAALAKHYESALTI